METTLEVILPVFGLVICGYLVGKTSILDEPGINGLTNFVFYVAIPVLMFRSILISEFPGIEDMGILLAYYAETGLRSNPKQPRTDALGVRVDALVSTRSTTDAKTHSVCIFPAQYYLLEWGDHDAFSGEDASDTRRNTPIARQ